MKDKTAGKDQLIAVADFPMAFRIDGVVYTCMIDPKTGNSCMVEGLLFRPNLWRYDHD